MFVSDVEARAGYVEDAAVNWSNGWSAWKDGDAERALKEWSKDGIFTDFVPRPARSYYWRARALDALGRHSEAQVLHKALAEKYPFDYYTFLVFPNGGAAVLTPGIYTKIAALFYPMPWKDEIAFASRATGLASETIWAVMRRESKFKQYALSRRGAVGLMQLMPATADEVAGNLRIAAEDLYSPRHNILVGAAHFASLAKQFDGELPRIVAAYNAGAACVSRWDTLEAQDWIEWVEAIPYAETREYVRSVLENREVYNLITGSKKTQRLCDIVSKPLIPVPGQSVAKSAKSNEREDAR